MRRSAVKADQAKDLFISNISHDLRSPLHGILANAELLSEVPDQSSADRTFLRNITLVATIDRADGQVVKKKPRYLTSEQSANVEVAFLGNSIPMETFKDSKDLGHVILRSGGDTIACRHCE
ncbi:hypothetical protein SAICODRAFT_35312 [Saitoella complicata NRRL Y-17804]|nr:uncharacterized protein SAICODRAFT_35312 [Saitoella complicata NRRL Y-17804]ODQ53068.1 hypothetical protein SAICODRAFT_35312 [Saitoella complicata NRRL Y-17804]